MISLLDQYFRDLLRKYDAEVQRLEEEIAALPQTAENAADIYVRREQQRALRNNIDRVAESLREVG